MPAGRPTKYKKEYCDLLIDHMSKGFSFESFAGKVNTCKQTIYTWLDKNPEFVDAKKRATAKCLEFWEAAGIEGIFNRTDYDENGKPLVKKSLNTGNYVFQMKNRFKWTDKVDIELDQAQPFKFAYDKDEE